MRNHFKNLLLQITPISDEEFDNSMMYFKEVVLKKGEFLVKEGEVCTRLGFVNRGILRSYFLNQNGEQVTYCFCVEQQLETAFKSFITQTPSNLSIQTLEESELLVIDYNSLQILFSQSKVWERLGRLLCEREYLKMEEQAFRAVNESAEEKYLRLLKEQPLIIQKAPLIYISSYLGITPRHLSRIRRQLISGQMSGAPK